MPNTRIPLKQVHQETMSEHRRILIAEQFNLILKDKRFTNFLGKSAKPVHDFLTTVQELKNHSLQQLKQGNPRFNYQQCRLLAQETKVLADNIIHNTLTEQHIAQFEHKTRAYHSSPLVKQVLKTLVDILVGALVGGLLGGLYGGIPGAIIGAAVGAAAVAGSKGLAAISNKSYLNLTFWAPPKTDAAVVQVRLAAEQNLAEYPIKSHPEPEQEHMDSSYSYAP